ncbi:MAG: alkaline phosphatase family protein [Bacteroidetes bacterium]|nr:alkaline phosphatase family protein [Bacteroidota bacterium]
MKLFITSLFVLSSLISFAQKNKKENAPLQKPKLVVGIVLDQMRWDYLQRFNSLFKSNGGFKRMINNGFSCDNTMLPYTPSVTACGHTCIYTGSVPNIHGITGNDWYDNAQNKNVYCTEDTTVNGVGDVSGKAGKQSPKNMLVTSICDELRLATNFKSKVIGIAAKDRGAILPAGHSANAAYWYNKETGSFISSTHYMSALPTWINDINNRKLVDSFYKLGWQTSLPKETYLQYCTSDEKPYENKAFGKEQVTFPYTLNQFINKDYNKILTTPYGNSLTIEMAKAALLNEQLGKNTATDFLAISFSSTDYIGHSYGPNSWELLDCYVRLDEELGKFFELLDAQLGANNYTVFLTADHAVAHIPAFLQEHKLPNGLFDEKNVLKELNIKLKESFSVDSLAIEMENYQVSFNLKKMVANNVDATKVYAVAIEYLKTNNAVANAFCLKDLMLQPMNNTVKQMLANGYYEQRCGQIQFILRPGYIDGWNTGTTHGLWNPYDAHIPLLWYGWGVKKGNTHRETYMTDIAATVAALLKIQMPSGCVGKVIEEVIK